MSPHCYLPTYSINKQQQPTGVRVLALKRFKDSDLNKAVNTNRHALKSNVITWDFCLGMRRFWGGGGSALLADGRQKRQHFEVSVATGFKSGSSYCVNHQTINPKDITRKYSDFWHREAFLKKT